MQLSCYPSRNGHIADVTCRRWTAFAFYFKLFPHCRHFIHRFARVTLHAHLSFATKSCALMLKKKEKKKRKRPWVHVQNGQFLISGKMPISALIPILQIRWRHPYIKKERSFLMMMLSWRQFHQELILDLLTFNNFL